MAADVSVGALACPNERKARVRSGRRLSAAMPLCCGFQLTSLLQLTCRACLRAWESSAHASFTTNGERCSTPRTDSQQSCTSTAHDACTKERQKHRNTGGDATARAHTDNANAHTKATTKASANPEEKTAADRRASSRNSRHWHLHSTWHDAAPVRGTPQRQSNKQ